VVSFGPFRFDPTNGLWRDGVEVPLPPRAIGVLQALVTDAGSVVSKQALLDASWRDTFVTEASLLEVIRLLREALGDDRVNPRYIQTVHRRGYRFVAAVSKVQELKGSEVHEFSGSRVQQFESSKGPQFEQSNTESLERQNFRTEEPRNLRTSDRLNIGTFAPLNPGTVEPLNLGRLEPWRPLIVAAASAVIATIGAAIVFALFGQRPLEPRPTMRFTIALPEDTAIDPLRGSVAVSLDGTRMVYVAAHEGRSRLFLRTIDRDALEAIEGSDGAADPFFSPDGHWIGFFAHGSLKKLRVEGGMPEVLCAARAGAGASWARDGTIIFGGGPGGGLARVSESGGEPVVLASPRAGSREVSYGWPDILPDGRAVIFTTVTLADTAVTVLDLATGVHHNVVESAAFGRYSPTGHLVFERRGRLEAVRFSPTDLTVTSVSHPILRGLATADAMLAGPRYAFSRTGSLIYVPSATADVDERLHWMDADGKLEPLPLPPAPIGAIDVTPNLQRLAVAVEGDHGQDLWVGDLERGAYSRLSLDGQSTNPTWRPDGLEIAFAYSKAGPFNLFVRPADNDGTPQPLLESSFNQFPTSWSPDGRFLAFTEVHPLTGADIWLLDLRTRERRQVVRTLFDESHARFSPDGRWLAYMSNESGRWDVFVRAVDGSSPRVQVSTVGGAWPCWSVDGRTLYFNASGHTEAAAVEATPVLRVSAPLRISPREDLQLAGTRADSNRVLVRQSAAVPSRRELRVVLEWFSELTRLVRLPA
jgi:eukaryotic-like serine/threonine-protein kinase